MMIVQRKLTRAILAASLVLGAVLPAWSESPEAQTDPAAQSPLMLYVVPWNANPDSKDAKKITLYKPWGEHFDPVTAGQWQALSPAPNP